MSAFRPGDRVQVTGGVCEFDVGTIKGPSPYTFSGERVWFVQLDGYSYVSTIREAFLAPEPTRSDDDVMAPLRNTVSG